MKSEILFDSHALLAFFQNEDGAEVVYNILQKSKEKRMDRLICIINLGEIIYMTKNVSGIEKKLKYSVASTNLHLRYSLLLIPWFIGRQKSKLIIQYLTPTALL
jgi:PIN domain nuclease of toxin-antitoxin system